MKHTKIYATVEDFIADKSSITKPWIVRAGVNNVFFSFEKQQTPTIFTYADGTTSITYDEIITSSSREQRTDLVRVEFGSSARIIESEAFHYCNTSQYALSIVIPETIERIETSAFMAMAGNETPYTHIYFTSNTPVSLEDNLGNIYDIFFIEAYEANTFIHVPDGLESYYATYDSGWELIAPFIVGYTPAVPSDEIWYTSTNGEIVEPTYNTALPEIVSNEYVDGKGIMKFAVPVTTIGEDAFNNYLYRNSNLASIILPNSVTSIEDSAFYMCCDLTSVTIPNSVTHIGSVAFSGSGLKSVVIPNVTTIDNSAFVETSVENIVIGKNVTHIGNNAFYNGGVIKSITFLSSTPQISLVDEYDNLIYIFGDKMHYLTRPFIYVPFGSEIEYATHDAGWEVYAPYIVGGPIPTIFTYDNGTTSLSYDQIITRNSYDDTRVLTGVEFGTLATSIADNAFKSIEGVESTLTTVTLSNTIQSIGDYAFNGCENLTSITIPSNVTHIGNGAFENINITITFESTEPISLVDEEQNVIAIVGGYCDSEPVNVAIYVPNSALDEYKTHDAGWEAIAEYVFGYDQE